MENYCTIRDNKMGGNIEKSRNLMNFHLEKGYDLSRGHVIRRAILTEIFEKTDEKR